MEFEERKMQMELKKLRLEREANRSAGEGREANQAGVRVLSFEDPLTFLISLMIKMTYTVTCYVSRGMLRLQTSPKLIGRHK